MPDSQTAESDVFELPPGADHSQLYLHDAMHFPAPLPVLAFEAIKYWIGGPSSNALARVNGYGYMSAAAGLFSRTGGATGWLDVHLPKVRELDSTIRARDYDSLSASELVASLPGVFEESAALFNETMLAMTETVGVTQPFLNFCETNLPPDGLLQAMTMLQGLENASASSGQRLGELAELARGVPAVASALSAGDFAALRTSPDAVPFVEAFDAYIDEYGRGTSTWFEIHKPTWSETPEIPLRMIARYVSSPELSPAAAQVRSNDQRAAAITSAESRLEPAKRDELHALLAVAQEYVPIVEGRALWQLRGAASLRLPILALGRRMVASGAVDDPADVFHFSLAELGDYAATGGPADLRAQVVQRRHELERWAKLTPPQTLGAPVPPAVLASIPELRSLFGFRLREGLPPMELAGSAASRGTARGVARVIRDIDDGDRLEPGEILVCPFTAPPWTPLFAIAAAVVTDAGGVLSHSAIAAREYGIPCVTGTGDGTRRIPDGAIITVDGTNGTVVIEG